MTMVIGGRFARALASQDPVAVREVLADTVYFEALTPRRHWTANTAEGVTDVLGVWSGGDAEIHDLLADESGEVGERERVSYRLGVRRDGQEFLVEQQAYFDTDGDRITWIRLLCAGFQPAKVNEP